MRFIQLDGFTSDWRDLGLDDEDLRSLENAIMARPAGSPVVPGTGGVRKLRFSPSRRARGKSGSLRVLYAVFAGHCVVILAAAYAKSEQVNISREDCRQLKALLAEIKELLEKGA